jgi:hypothetical protein
MEFDIRVLLENLSTQFSFHYISHKHPLLYINMFVLYIYDSTSPKCYCEKKFVEKVKTRTSRMFNNFSLDLIPQTAKSAFNKKRTLFTRKMDLN